MKNELFTAQRKKTFLFWKFSESEKRETKKDSNNRKKKLKKLFNMICDKDSKISSHFGFPGARNINVFFQ